MSFLLRVGAATDQGLVRGNNQDAFGLAPDRHLFIVADGMGGHRGGEVAARMAVETIEESYAAAGADELVHAMLVANRRIYDRAHEDPELRGMGTTAVVAALAPVDTGVDTGEGQATAERMQLLIANVGDSRAYLYRDGELIQLTEDHSVVADLVRQGRISAEEAEQHPQRNVVTRVLGVYEDIDVDLWPVDPLDGDRYVLCSDGLFNEVEQDTIGAVLRRLEGPDEAAEELVRLANAGGGRDNVTVVVIDVAAIDAKGGAGGAAPSSVALGAAGHRSGIEPDLAGFSTAAPARAAGAPVAPGEPASRHARSSRARTRITWRVVAFVAVLVAVLGGAYLTVVWYGTSAYHVAFAGDDVAIFKGRPGGLLWIEPELVEVTPLSRDQVPARWLAAVEAGHEQPSLADSRRFVANVARDAGLDERGRPITTTTTRPTTTGPTATTEPTATTPVEGSPVAPGGQP